MNEALPDIIRDARKHARMTQSDMAEATGLSRVTIGKIESAAIIDVTLSNIDRVLEVLDLELAIRPRGRPPTLEELNRKRRGK